ncbi:MAG: sensor histidine kinase [Bacteriovoracia bacterium]
MRPSDEALFRSFQSNLLSLISHELRTPLTGILNSLGILEEQGDTPGEFSVKELVGMARRNALRLHQTLGELLDLAAMESGTFHARLREIDFPRLVHRRCAANAVLFKGQGLQFEFVGNATFPIGGQPGDLAGSEQLVDVTAPILGDPQKLGRAVDLVLQVLVARAQPGSHVQIKYAPHAIDFRFEIPAPMAEEWKSHWVEASVAFKSGAGSAGAAFRGTVGTQEAFLTRTREGIGSELLLVHQILHLHHGKFTQQAQSSPGKVEIVLTLSLPELSSRDAIRAVISSRIFESSTDLSSVALALIAVPSGEDVDAFRGQMRKCLFRASDAAYSLADRGEVAIVMDDCKLGDAPRLLGRIEKTLGSRLKYGIVTCPEEGTDPETLLELAEKRLKSSS